MLLRSKNLFVTLFLLFVILGLSAFLVRREPKVKAPDEHPSPAPTSVSVVASPSPVGTPWVERAPRSLAVCAPARGGGTPKPPSRRRHTGPAVGA